MPTLWGAYQKTEQTAVLFFYISPEIAPVKKNRKNQQNHTANGKSVKAAPKSVRQQAYEKTGFQNVQKATKKPFQWNGWCRRRPIFPGSFPPSIFGTCELNFRVRDGNGWDLNVIDTEYIRSCPYRTQ